jgi:hypothetical protein
MVKDEAEFNRLLNSLSTGKQPGPDAIPNDVLLAAPPFSKPAYTFSPKYSGPQACTRDRWKDSHTVLLYKNKGTILELGYYRRIGLENTLYKLWTKVVHNVLATYAEKHCILSQEQGGFRAHRNTIHQLETHTMLLEDARLMGQDIFLVMVDLKEAFDTIDHSRMLKVVQDLDTQETDWQSYKDYIPTHTQESSPHMAKRIPYPSKGAPSKGTASPLSFSSYTWNPYSDGSM